MERFIRRYSFSPSDCDALVAWFEDNPDFHTTAVISNNSGSNIVDYRVKDATCINLNLEDAYGINTNFSSFLDFLWESVNSYVAEFIELSYMNFSMLEAFQISRYNGLEGGTNFKYLEHSETAEKGKLLIWPPDFTHTHNGIVDTEKYKYIITGWYNLASF